MSPSESDEPPGKGGRLQTLGWLPSDIEDFKNWTFSWVLVRARPNDGSASQSPPLPIYGPADQRPPLPIHRPTDQRLLLQALMEFSHGLVLLKTISYPGYTRPCNLWSCSLQTEKLVLLSVFFKLTDPLGQKMGRIAKPRKSLRHEGLFEEIKVSRTDYCIESQLTSTSVACRVSYKL